MLNAIVKFASLSVLALIGVVGLRFYRNMTATQGRINDLVRETTELKDVIGRIEAERRVADFLVAEQSRVEGKLKTTLFMVEYDRNGRALPARSFDVIGDRVHLDGLVIKFLADDVKKPDPLRGHALLLLEKIYGDAQAPADGARIDEVGQIPAVYRDTDPKVGDFEKSLWRQFWQLASDESLRQTYRVKVAHGMGVFVEPKVGRRYAVTLQADGNLSVADEPLPQIFEGFMKQPADR